MDLFIGLIDARLSIGGATILWREILGNAFGLACAYGGMRRVVWAWPVGIIGNALLFTVFLGGVFHTPQDLDLYGQAGRQVMFIAVSVYGWWRWSRTRAAGRREAAGVDPSRSVVAAVRPRWATGRQRAAMAVFWVAGTVACAWAFTALGSWGPWADAWIFTGSMLATWGMARGLTEFWLVWIGVDIVGVPLLLAGGYYPSAVLYLVYAGFVIWGFVTWLRAGRAEPAAPAPAPARVRC